VLSGSLIQHRPVTTKKSIVLFYNAEKKNLIKKIKTKKFIEKN
jgi:hypothetical protein